MLRIDDHYMIKQLRRAGAFIVDIAHAIGCVERTVGCYLGPLIPSQRENSSRSAWQNLTILRGTLIHVLGIMSGIAWYFFKKANRWDIAMPASRLL